MFESLFETISSGLLWATGIALVGALAYWAYNTYIKPDDKGAKTPAADAPARQPQREVAPEQQKLLSVNVNTPVAAAMGLLQDSAIPDNRKPQLQAVLTSIPNSNATIGDAAIADVINKIKVGSADRYDFIGQTNYKNLRAIEAGDLANAKKFFPDMKQPEFDAFKNLVKENSSQPEGNLPTVVVANAFRNNMTTAIAAAEAAEKEKVAAAAKAAAEAEKNKAAAKTGAVDTTPPEFTLIKDYNSAFKLPPNVNYFDESLGSTALPSQSNVGFSTSILGAAVGNAADAARQSGVEPCTDDRGFFGVLLGGARKCGLAEVEDRTRN